LLLNNPGSLFKYYEENNLFPFILLHGAFCNGTN
jgi:hypothetical protein